MKRPIARWLISRSIDDPTCPVPAWVHRAMQRDASLNDYHRSARQLTQQLKEDAAKWVAAADVPAVIRPASHVKDSREAQIPETGGILLAVTLVASLLIAISFWWDTRDDQRTPQLGSAPLVRAPEQPSLDLQSLEDSWNVGRRMVHQLSQQAEELAGSLTVPDAPRLVRDAGEPVASAGVAYGRALAMLDRGVQQEQDRVAAEIRGTVHFFARHLPAQVANTDRAPPP